MADDRSLITRICYYSNKIYSVLHTVYENAEMEVIHISGIPVEPNRYTSYLRKIGDTEITVENIEPNFKTDEERKNAKSQIMQVLYKVFSKYDEDC